MNLFITPWIQTYLAEENNDRIVRVAPGALLLTTIATLTVFLGN